MNGHVKFQLYQQELSIYKILFFRFIIKHFSKINYLKKFEMAKVLQENPSNKEYYHPSFV